MSVYVNRPSFTDGVPPLTDRQEARLSEWLNDIHTRLGLHLPGRHALAWNVQDEHRPGRGHDIEVSAVDGEHMAWLSIDPYGNGHDGWGMVTVVHNSAADECSCEDCTDFRRADD